jgi:hypothetical protein
VAGQTEHEALHGFIHAVQRALSCVSDTVFQNSGYHQRAEPHVLTFAQGDPVHLRCDRGLLFSATIHYRLVPTGGYDGPWKVSTQGYAYTLFDRDEREILAFHWHPFGHSAVAYTHLHLEAGAGVSFEPLAKTHIPTGRVALEDVIQMAITQLEVRPLRQDWEAMLNETRNAYLAARTWA